MKLIEALNWRYATKKYDNTKKVSSEDLDQLKEAVRLSASSFGLQLYKVLVVEDLAIKEKLLPATYGQTPVVDSSQLFVFCNYTKVLSAETKVDLISRLKEFKACDGPALLEVKIRNGARENLGRPTTTPIENKLNLMKLLK